MISVLVLTQSLMGQQLVDAVSKRKGAFPIDCHTLTFNPEAHCEIVFPHISNRIDNINKGDGVLILMDSSQGHEALINKLVAKNYCCCICGLNDPMLNALYLCADLSLFDAAQLISEHAQKGIVTYIIPETHIAEENLYNS